MSTKKIRINSNSISYGPMPNANTEVEQHITINNRGRVWLSRYRFGNGEERYPLIEKEYFHISEEITSRILELAEKMVETEDEVFVTDVGSWELIISDESGQTRKSLGSLILNDSEIVQELCSVIRKALDRSDLMLLDGNHN